MTFPIAFPAFGEQPPDTIERSPENHRVVSDDMVVTLHTSGGVTLYEFDPDQYTSVNWGRVSRNVSTMSLAAPPDADVDRLAEIEPWRDWTSVWDGTTNELLWRGPIMVAKDNRAGLTLSAKDHAAYLTRTRNPITKRWDAKDPALIAGELWTRMMEVQGLNARPIIRADPEGQTFDFHVQQNIDMLDQTIGELMDKGLRYTVISGTPVVGPLGREPLFTLGEDDFEGDGLTFVKDGSATYNDVLLRGGADLARARVEYHGQNLQTIVNVDSMFGVSNVKSAADAYVKETGRSRVRLELGANTTLKNTAPVSIHELMPSVRCVIEARGIRQLFELTGVTVDRRAGAAQIQVTMESVEPDLELTRQQGAQLPPGGGGVMSR